LGIAGNIGKPRSPKMPPPPPPIPAVVVKDRDNDGVVDSLDACPDVAGLAAFNGCPDTDGDGIADKDDKCPTVAGLAKYAGCPIPDTDGDGINDEQDKCPTVAGVARYQGCPIPDTDADGVNDEEDKCPTIPGVKENNGCPVIKEEVAKKIAANAKDIFFATGSSKLLPKSFKSLNEVVTILKSDANLKLDVEGHTDNAGKADKNMLLSDARAKAVMTYLTTKGGIDAARLTAKGFGATQPIADNKTAKGKALNRRVALKLRYY
jgi:outer membrane protein OmpA-like peptidoglycan-associated protein